MKTIDAVPSNAQAVPDRVPAPGRRTARIAQATTTLTRGYVAAPTPQIAALPPSPGEASPIADRAAEQHAVFLRRLHADGVRAECIETGSPWGFAVADLALVTTDGAILMRPTDRERQAEVALVEQLLTQAQIPVLGRIEPPGLLDGGDVIVASRTLYVAASRDDRALIGVPHAKHGNAAARTQLATIAQRAGLRVVEVALSAHVRRLRAVASMLEHDVVLLAPSVVDHAAFDDVRVLEVERGEEYGAGVLALGRRRLVANLRFRRTLPGLRKAGYAVDAIDLWEFGKIGVTPSLLALPIG